MVLSDLKSIGRRMPREKSQRPEVFATGKREKLWKVRYREYYVAVNGKEKFRNKAATWSRKDHTKAEAQAKADEKIRGLKVGAPKADGTMKLADFWKAVYLPIRKRKWTGHTPRNVEAVWRNHIEKQLGSMGLQDIKKAHVQIRLAEMADAGLGEVSLKSVLVRLHSVLGEALDNDYIGKNPCHKVELPPCAESEETRSLTEGEVAALWDQSTGRDYVWWRLLILTGARPGEMVALDRMDITPEGLSIDETLVRLPGNVHAKLPKGNKIRLAVLTDSLREELGEWLASHSYELVFPSGTSRRARGSMYSHHELDQILARGRTLIPDLTFRMCRTTFASLFQGDEADRSSIMGHFETSFTLDVYRKPIMERRQKSVEEMDKRLRKVIPFRKTG